MSHYLVEYAELGNAEAREALRPDHIGYRKGLGGGMALAGPLLDDAGSPVGSVVILEAEDRAEAERIASADPYVAAEVLELVSVRAYRIVAMNPPQG
ncbi:YciI family protein [Parasphingopyxis marina]|uniref:YCII-related domain-containing protein n=1 Tax=Parasphingopyxis marina TaxID=2761622 RepID=A0A842I1W0_9SPHN|nr:YciI family protein [Parasphingopyxis marina]MBC2778907.1 hypothetical protein [Parasphingopyxis marina]